MLTGHGNNTFEIDIKIMADFSSNVLFHEIHPMVLHFMNQHLHELNVYPDPLAREMVQKIADYHHVAPQNIIVLNGAVEGIYMLAQLFKGVNSLMGYPTFSEYEDACHIFNHQLHFIHNMKLLTSGKNKDIVWLCNPNNPDGFVYSPETIDRFCLSNPTSMLIIDETYAEQCIGFQSAMSIIKKHRNLCILRSISKLAGIPGIRLGYLVGNKALIEKIYHIKMPWSVNSLAIKTGSFIMDHFNELLAHRDELLKESINFQQLVSELEWTEVFASSCNFFLLRLKNGKSAQLKEYLITNHGMLIRNASNFRGLDDSYIRLSSRQRHDNEKLIRALAEWNG